MICRMIGNALFAGQQGNAFGLLPDRDHQMTLNAFRLIEAPL